MALTEKDFTKKKEELLKAGYSPYILWVSDSQCVMGKPYTKDNLGFPLHIKWEFMKYQAKNGYRWETFVSIELSSDRHLTMNAFDREYDVRSIEEYALYMYRHHRDFDKDVFKDLDKIV